MSTRIKLTDFEALRKTDSGLFHAMLEPGIAKAEPNREVVVIDETAIKGTAFREAWKRWLDRNPDKVLSTSTEKDELWQEQQAQAQRDAQKAREAEAVTRANWWIAEGNLLPSDHNLQLIQRFIREKTDGLSAKNFDLAVNQLREQLQWKQVVPAAPAAPPPPVLLADGSEQLPIGTVPRSRFTKLQLQDLDRREREARNAAVLAANNEVAKAFAAAAVSEITL